MNNHKTAQENTLGCNSETSLSATEVLAEPPLSVLLIRSLVTRLLITQFTKSKNHLPLKGASSNFTLYPLDG